jgi:hypothetical protein
MRDRRSDPFYRIGEGVGSTLGDTDGVGSTLGDGVACGGTSLHANLHDFIAS